MTTPIPQPPGIPLLGNIFDVDPNNTWVSLKKLADKYGEIFKITALGQQIVFIANVALCEEICDEKRFRKCVAGPVVEIRHSVHDSLFTAFDDEPSWGVAHRIMAPVLSQSAVDELFNEMSDLASELTSHWIKQNTNSRVNLQADLARSNLQAVTLNFYGRKMDYLNGPVPSMINGMEGSTSEAMKRPTRPGFLNKLFYQRTFDDDTKTMRQYATEMVEHRKANPTDRRDMLHALMNAKDPATGEGLDDQRVIDEIVTLPIGASTAPGLVASAMYYLLQNPECIIKARQEINTVIGPKGKFTYGDLPRLQYCEGIIRESLRLSAAAPGFNIEPIPSTTVPVLLGGGKYQIPAKQMMIIVLAAVNRDPAVFEDPEAFKPERMIGEAFDKLPNGAKKWFGNGKRECIGKLWAWQWSIITLATILRDVDIEKADTHYELKQDGWFNLRPVDFFVKIRLRSD